VLRTIFAVGWILNGTLTLDLVLEHFSIVKRTFLPFFTIDFSSSPHPSFFIIFSSWNLFFYRKKRFQTSKKILLYETWGVAPYHTRFLKKARQKLFNAASPQNH
jgi:hypothetical protein